MTEYIFRRLLYAFILIFFVSVISFIIIQAPPGDFASSYVAQISQGSMPEARREEILSNLRNRYALDQPVYIQYYKWIYNIVTAADFGMSFNWNRPVVRIIKERVPLTIMLGLFTLIFQFIIAIPVGIYTAVKKHTFWDYVFTFLTFIGRSIPNFLLALIMMVFLFTYFDISIGGLFSQEYQNASWSLLKFFDMLKHLLVPIIVIGTASTAGTVRILRATMLDELGKEYMSVARAKGLAEWQAVLKYPVRIALNPIISALGWQLPQIISGALIVSLVVNLPTTGPMLYQALMSQDMYLAGAFLLVLSTFTIFGTLISDILLALSDPRISYL